LLAAVALDRVLREGVRAHHKGAAITILALFSAVVVWFQARTLAHWYFLFDPDAHRRCKLWDMCVMDKKLQEMAQYIRRATNPTDRIFVWGPSPEFYFLSGRRMATQYPFFNVVDDSQPPYGGEEQETLRVLMENPPALIVDHFKYVRMADQSGWKDLLARHYRSLVNGDEIRIYIRKDKR